MSLAHSSVEHIVPWVNSFDPSSFIYFSQDYHRWFEFWRSACILLEFCLICIEPTIIMDSLMRFLLSTHNWRASIKEQHPSVNEKPHLNIVRCICSFTAQHKKLYDSNRAVEELFYDTLKKSCRSKAGTHQTYRSSYLPKPLNFIFFSILRITTEIFCY